MENFIKKHKVGMLVCVLVFVVLVLGLTIAKGIVGKSYSSEEYVAEKEGVDTEPEVNAPDVEDDFQMEYSGELSGGVDKVSQMFNPDRVENDLERYLEGIGESYEDFVPVLTAIENASAEAFSKISKGTPKEYEEIERYNYADSADLSAEQLLIDGKCSIIDNSLVVVGLFDGNKVIYGYNFPESSLYVCVDYSESEFLTEYGDAWKIGDVKSISVIAENSTYRDMGTYEVIYTKG